MSLIIQKIKNNIRLFLLKKSAFGSQRRATLFVKVIIKKAMKTSIFNIIFVGWTGAVLTFFVGLQILAFSNDLIGQTKPKNTVTGKSKTVKHKNKRNMNQQKTKELSSGNWGGQGVGLVIEENGANIQFDCAEAEIKEKISINEKGVFSVDGEYIRNGPGPIRLNMPSRRQPAHFDGKISGDEMTLTVTLTKSKDKIGEFKLKLGQTPIIHRCL